MKIHQSPEVWQRAIDFAVRVYETTAGFPKSEEYGLTSQMRRAAISIASNIAEGAARRTKNEFIQFLYMAVGSASEIDTHLELAARLG